MKQFRLFTLLFIAVFAATAFTSCEKEGDMHDDHDHSHVDISFMKPTDGETFMGGSDTVTVHLHIEMESDETIHHVQVTVTDKSDDSDVYTYMNHEHAEDGMVSHHADVEIYADAHTDFEVTARVMDHDMNEIELATRGFHVHP